jgi:hypothetical protein
MPLQVSLQCVLLVDAERAQGTLVILFLDKIPEKLTWNIYRYHKEKFIEIRKGRLVEQRKLQSQQSLAL